MHKHLLGLLIPVAGILMANPALALTESFGPVTYTTQPSNGGTSVSLNQFNPSLGTLTSVALTLSGTTSFYVDAENSSTTSQVVGVTSASINTDVLLNSNTLVFVTPTYTATSVSNTTLPSPDFASTLVLSNAPASATSSPNVVNSSLLSLFQGTSTISLAVDDDLNSFLATTNNTATDSAGNPLVSTSPDDQLATTGTLSVTYTYTQVPFEFSPNQLGLCLVPLLLGMRVIKKRM